MKLTLNPVTNINSITTINDNFDRIEQIVQDRILFRDNPVGEPNTLEDDLDVNGKILYNVGGIDTPDGLFAPIEKVIEYTEIAENAAIVASEAAETATTKAGTATTQAGLATTAATNAAASYDSFDDRYLGAKASAPTLDNDGNTIIEGALYFNSTSGVMSVRRSGVWQPVGFDEVTLASSSGAGAIGTSRSSTVEAELTALYRLTTRDPIAHGGLTPSVYNMGASDIGRRHNISNLTAGFTKFRFPSTWPLYVETLFFNASGFIQYITTDSNSSTITFADPTGISGIAFRAIALRPGEGVKIWHYGAGEAFCDFFGTTAGDENINNTWSVSGNMTTTSSALFTGGTAEAPFGLLRNYSTFSAVQSYGYGNGLLTLRGGVITASTGSPTQLEFHYLVDASAELPAVTIPISSTLYTPDISLRVPFRPGQVYDVYGKVNNGTATINWNSVEWTMPPNTRFQAWL